MQTTGSSRLSDEEASELAKRFFILVQVAKIANMEMAQIEAILGPALAPEIVKYFEDKKPKTQEYPQRPA